MTRSGKLIERTSAILIALVALAVVLPNIAPTPSAHEYGFSASNSGAAIGYVLFAAMPILCIFAGAARWHFLRVLGWVSLTVFAAVAFQIF